MHAYSKPLVRSMTRSLSLAVQHPDSLEEEAVFELASVGSDAAQLSARRKGSISLCERGSFLMQATF